MVAEGHPHLPPLACKRGQLLSAKDSPTCLALASKQIEPYLRGSREDNEILFSKAPTKAFSHCCR